MASEMQEKISTNKLLKNLNLIYFFKFQKTKLYCQNEKVEVLITNTITSIN
jgi:hypothetical protein